MGLGLEEDQCEIVAPPNTAKLGEIPAWLLGMVVSTLRCRLGLVAFLLV